MKQIEAVQLVGVLAAAYPNFPVSEATIQVYAAALGDLETSAAVRAAEELVATSRFFPTVAEIRAAAAERTMGLPTPEEALGLVLGEVRRCGIYGRPRFDCPVVAEAVRVVGFRNICTSDNPEALRAHFFRVYGAYRDREIREASVGGLSLSSGGFSALPD